jgi:hypothetical protein
MADRVVQEFDLAFTDVTELSYRQSLNWELKPCLQKGTLEERRRGWHALRQEGSEWRSSLLFWD